MCNTMLNYMKLCWLNLGILLQSLVMLGQPLHLLLVQEHLHAALCLACDTFMGTQVGGLLLGQPHAKLCHEGC